MIPTFKTAPLGVINAVYSGVQPVELGAVEEDIIAYRKRMFKEFGVSGLSDVSALSGANMVGFLATVPTTRLLAANFVFTGLKIRARQFSGGAAQKDLENSTASLAERANLLGLSRRAALMWAKSNIETAFTKTKNPELTKLRSALIEVLSDTPSTDEAVAASLSATAGTLNSALLGKTWNDGKNSYTIDAAGSVATGKKTFKKGDAKYATVADNLNKDLASGTLKSGAAPARQRAYTAPEALPTVPETSTPGLQTSSALTDAWWFWPTVGVSTLAVAGGVYWVFLRKKE